MSVIRTRNHAISGYGLPLALFFLCLAPFPAYATGGNPWPLIGGGLVIFVVAATGIIFILRMLAKWTGEALHRGKEKPTHAQPAPDIKIAGIVVGIILIIIVFAALFY